MIHSDRLASLDQSKPKAIFKSMEKPEAYVDTLTSIFDIFHPKTGRVGDWQLFSIACRARSLLEKRSGREIEFAVRAAQWMVQNPVNIETHWCDPSILDSLPRALYHRRQLFTLDSLDGLPNARWTDFLAALALAYVGVTEFGLSDRKTEALEAVCLAEEAASVDGQVREKVKKSFSARQSQAAQKRHAATNAQKEKAIKYVLTGQEEGRFKFVTQGVRSFVRTLTDEERKLYGDNNRERALRNAVYAYRKKKDQSPIS